MKTIRVILQVISVFLIVQVLFTLSSCSKKEDPAPQVKIPKITYSNTTIDAEFFKDGNSSAPTIDWGGEKGTLSLSKDIKGLSLDASTGILSWTKELPAGEHSFDVIAVNSAGQASTTITIKNILEGSFVGTYSSGIDHYYNIRFFKDGTAKVIANDPDLGDEASGTWSQNGDEILVNYKYESGFKYSTKGTLIQTASEARYEGNWYDGYDAQADNLGGEFSLTLEQ